MFYGLMPEIKMDWIGLDWITRGIGLLCGDSRMKPFSAIHPCDGQRDGR